MRSCAHGTRSIVTYYCDLEKGGSVEPSEPPWIRHCHPHFPNVKDTLKKHTTHTQDFPNTKDKTKDRTSPIQKTKQKMHTLQDSGCPALRTGVVG